MTDNPIRDRRVTAVSGRTCISVCNAVQSVSLRPISILFSQATSETLDPSYSGLLTLTHVEPNLQGP